MGRQHAWVGVALSFGLSGCDPKPDGEAPKPTPKVAKADDDKADAKADDKPEDKADDKADDKPEDEPDDKPDDEPDEKPGEDDPPAVADPEAPAPGTPAKPTTVELRADLHTTVAIDGGVTLKVAAQAEQPKSTLWVERPGTPPERFTLRTTTGEVEDLAAVWDGARLWVAWRSAVPSTTGGEDRALVASAGYDAELASVGKAKILRSFTPAGELAEGSVAMLPRSGGGATVAALTGTERCFSDIEEAMTTCPRMQLDVIAASGDVVRTETRSLDGGDPGVDALIDAETGAAFAFHSFRGGPLTEAAFVPYDPAAPAVSLVACSYPDIDLAFSMDTIVSMCPDPDSDNTDQFADGCRGEAGSSCGTIAVSDRAGKAFGPSTSAAEVPLSGVKVACDEGKRVLELSWAKDGTRAAGSIRLPSGAPCK